MNVRAFGSWMSAPKCLFFQEFEGLTEGFAPGHPPGYPHARPRNIRPQNLLCALLFRSSRSERSSSERFFELCFKQCIDKSNVRSALRGGTTCANSWRPLRAMPSCMSTSSCLERVCAPMRDGLGNGKRGAKRITRFWGGGGGLPIRKCTTERVLQNHF